MPSEVRCLEVKVEKHCVFDGPNGKETLADLFDGRSQLIVKHFMFGPDEERGCVGCAFSISSTNAPLIAPSVSPMELEIAPLPSRGR